ncbi:MAG: acyltransferase domain-containing protein [Oscillospiraceae bacterium]|nr:acyltransferase domain-containing protein [Oscillospiraceae bacterium]
MREKSAVLALAEELALPEQVMGPLARAAETLPVLPLRELAAPETAEAAWKAVTASVPIWREDDGMAHLAAALGGACYTREVYRENGVPEDVFFATMGCFARFLRETWEITGKWVFDRGFWTWRQTGGRLFRLGTLEFEYLPGEGALGVHIPSDAVLSREELDRSYGWAERFFSGEGRAFCRQGPPVEMRCSSWLLAPALAEMLPEGSGIRRFAGDYRLCEVLEDDREFYRWLFKCVPALPTEDLPEDTSLQRAAKDHLAAGGKIGAASGVRVRK